MASLVADAGGWPLVCRQPLQELLRELAESDPDDDVREHCVKALRAMPAP